ncbi:helix-turn-helix domain-containing protein [Cellulosilyticum sp. I15G10I2]|uniref:helix-turn-helix domain-containing protein n=1 Tax=Cellulosilyticum sp. I15G10I2 TaxID=1892843 RepID=UPI00085C04BF|nr:helix-turn-helix domain-containing protein [Cellulosilyticum sp. I15G10I2]
MISYNPLWHLLIELGKERKHLNEEIGIHWSTIKRMKNNESVSADTLEKICLHFDVPIEKIIEIKKSPSI